MGAHMRLEALKLLAELYAEGRTLDEILVASRTQDIVALCAMPVTLGETGE